MLVSINALRKLVDIEGLTAEQIADGLIFAGIEVEEIKTLASGTNLVIGEIIDCQNHENSDHLHVLKVDLGPKYGIEQIVCGAPNARKGLKVIVARVGAVLPGGTINSGVIRGVASNGMCCSLLELGVESKYLNEAQTKGIEELPIDAVIGNEDVLGYLGLDDKVLNLKILANRPDLLSLINVAREVGAIFERKLSLPKTSVHSDFESDIIVGSTTENCSQFSIKEVKNIKVKQSPEWMKQFLRSMGVRSINNIVDIGNYVMLMTGQPLHMYDADKLAKKELIARDDLETEFVALDEKTYSVIPGDITIACDGVPMCLGGVMGAHACEVDDNTTHIYIESASFAHFAVRKTSSRLGLSSESSQRFVKGTYHFQYDEVLEYTSDLLIELAEASGFSKNKTYQSEKDESVVIKYSLKGINDRLGTNFSLEEVKGALNRLYFEVEGEDELIVTAPKHRLDISCDADISEEVIRLLGFSHVKSVLPCVDTTLGHLSDDQLKERLISEYLLGIGLDKCLTYSLISEKENGLIDLLSNDEPYVLLNPLTDDRKIFRRGVIGSLLSSASYNVARQNKNLGLFEISNVQTKNKQSLNIAVVLTGDRLERGMMRKTPVSFFDMKGIVESIFSLLGIENTRYKLSYINSNKDKLHPGKSCEIAVQGKVVGYFGELHPTLCKHYDFQKLPVVILEVNLDALFQIKVGQIKAKPISKFPYVSRDLALVVNKTVLSSDIIKAIKMVGKGLVKEACIFDVYEGEHVEANKKSVAVSITYSDETHTLTEKEVSDCEEKIKYELAKKLGATLRI